MNSLPTSPAVRRLALGVSRGVRPTCLVPTISPAAAATLSSTAPVMNMRISRHERKLAERRGEPPGLKDPKSKAPPPKPHVVPAHHGETIWIHNHTYDGHVLLSFDRVMDSKDRLRQMPYTGKKLVPAKLRKDYWEPMAMIQLPMGLGEVGRSVYQKLRELKKRHELEWGRDDPDEEKRLLNMSRHDRGKAINDQRANVVADMAAVLGGYGRGNKMWMMPWTAEWEAKGVQVRKSPKGNLVPLREKGLEGVESLRQGRMGVQVQTAGKRDKFVDLKGLVDHFVVMPDGEGEGRVATKEELEGLGALHKVRVYWNENNLAFKDYAVSWTDNVEHVNGLGQAAPRKGFVFEDAKQPEEVAI